MEAHCPILGRRTAVEPTEFTDGTWKLVRCRETGFVFLPDPPSYEQLQSEYAWEATAAAEMERRRQAEPVVSRLSRAWSVTRQTLFPKRNIFFKLASWSLRKQKIERTARFLDVGCGGGTLMCELTRRFGAQGRNIVPIGIEVSTELAKECDEQFSQFGGHVIAADALGGTADVDPGSYEVVIMASFLEHEAKPLELLRQVRDNLTDDGVVILKVPNFGCLSRSLRGTKWCGFRYPDHVNYFTPATLEELARNAGFRVLRQGWREKLPTSDSMYAVLAKAAPGVSHMPVARAA